MKYRMLSEEELGHLEDELKQFLIVNGVDGETWAKINEEAPIRATELVGLFSDTVLQHIYEKLHYLEFRSTDSCMLFYIGQSEVHLISITPKAGVQVDLSSPESIHKTLLEQAHNLSYFETSKPFKSSREEEVHELIEQGCVVSTQSFWDAICSVIR